MEVSSSEPQSCPSGDDTAPVLEKLNQDLDRIIDDELPTLQQFTGPLECPGYGWIKLLDFNLERNSSTPCPGNWTKGVKSEITHCTVTGLTDCASAFFNTPSSSLQYTEVCGRIKGYQIGLTNAFFRAVRTSPAPSGIESSYLDGVSITCGDPKTHVWSFAAGYTSSQGGNTATSYRCPCSINGTVDVSSLVQSHYFCDSGVSSGQQPMAEIFYANNPLWDDATCLPDGGCCRQSRYFWRNLIQPTCNSLEVRLCHDKGVSNLINIGVSVVELYIK